MTGLRRLFPLVLLAAATLICAVGLERSLACPIELPPQPLRTLYKLSERVVVARVGAKEVLKNVEGVAFVRVALHVTENVKGEPARLLYLHQTELIEDEGGEDAVVITLSAFSGREIPKLKRGERYLFFLEQRKEGGGYEVNDESYGIKRLSDEDLKVYLERMKELDDILRPGTEDQHALVEWLVRCAEQPATRWEGAYELLESVKAAALSDEMKAKVQAAAEAQAQSIKEAAAQTHESAAPEMEISLELTPERSETRPPAFGGFRYTFPDPALVPLLNAVQKQRLADAFVATPDLKPGDDELMQLVKDFDDPRFPTFLLARLHRVESEAPIEAELWMRMLAASLKNEQLIKLADTYAQQAAYYEWDEEPAAEAPADSAAAGSANGDEEGAAEEVEETPVDPAVEAAREAAAAERATIKRSAVLSELLARIDLFVSTGQLAAAQP